MSFPVEYDVGLTDERDLFIVQDPAVRARVLPLFSFDPNHPNERPAGHGTTFRIDPWTRCLTAYHVMEDLLLINAAGTGADLRPDLRLAALELNGLGFGLVPMPPNAWRALAGSVSIVSVETPPLQPPRLRNIIELIVLQIPPSAPSPDGTPYYQLDLRRWRPRIGEHVMALGFADLDREGTRDAPMSQYLYGSLGEITDIEQADGARARPWPFIRVAGEWPGGMSGGPVFNEAGHVIGVVSSGIEGMNVGNAAIFSGWDMPARIMGSIDPDNPGWFWCHGVFNQAGQLVHASQVLETARRFAQANGLTDLAVVSVHPQSGDHFRQ